VSAFDAVDTVVGVSGTLKGRSCVSLSSAWRVNMPCVAVVRASGSFEVL
jgi:hypothetical protein